MYIFSVLTPNRRDNIAQFSSDPEQRNKQGFHINECTRTEFDDMLTRHHFIVKTDIITGRFRHIFPIVLIPVKMKAWIEHRVPLTHTFLPLLRLAKVYIQAQKQG